MSSTITPIGSLMAIKRKSGSNVAESDKLTFNINLQLLKDQLYLAVLPIVKEWVDESNELSKEFYRELRKHTDAIAELKMAIATAPNIPAKANAMRSLEYVKASIDTMCLRYKIVFTSDSAERVKEVLIAVAKTLASVAVSIALAAAV